MLHPRSFNLQPGLNLKRSQILSRELNPRPQKPSNPPRLKRLKPRRKAALSEQLPSPPEHAEPGVRCVNRCVEGLWDNKAAPRNERIFRSPGCLMLLG